MARPLDEEALKCPFVVTNQVDAKLLDYLDRGGRVVLLCEGALKDYGSARPAPTARCLGTPARTATWERSFGIIPPWESCRTTGGAISTSSTLISGAFPILLDVYRPERIRPIIRSIGHKNTMVDKAYLFEVGVGKGAVLATSLRFAKTYDSHPQTRYLLDSFPRLRRRRRLLARDNRRPQGVRRDAGKVGRRHRVYSKPVNKTSSSGFSLSSRPVCRQSR